MNHPRPGNALRELLQPGPDCYAPEDLLPESIAALSAAEDERLQQHMGRCVRCSAERDLAGEFEAPPEQLRKHRNDVEFVVDRLQAAARPVAFPRPGRRSIAGWTLAVAAAILLVASVGLFQLGPEGPALPDRAGTTTLRGGIVELIGPFGVESEWPATLQWAEFENAALYRVQLIAPDGTILGSETLPECQVALDDLIDRSVLRKATVYSWSVAALDADGRSLAQSERRTFSVREPLRGS